MWVKVSQSGRCAEQQSGDGGASPFDRPGERRRKGPPETAGRVSGISGSSQGHQGFYHDIRLASGSNLSDVGVESQRGAVSKFRRERGRVRASGFYGESIRRRRRDRQIRTLAPASPPTRG